MANIEREPLGEKKKTIYNQVLLKSIVSATLSISIPFKAFSLSKYFNTYITVYIIKWAPFVLLIQGLKKKHVSGLSVAEKKNTKFTTFLISNLKYKPFSIHYYSL